MEILKKKPVLFLAVSVGYALGVGILKWKIVWPPQAFLYFGGAILGVYFWTRRKCFCAHAVALPVRRIHGSLRRCEFFV